MSPASPSDSSARSSRPVVIAIIPARYASTRLPGKPLADIAGEPMIAHVFRRAARASSIHEVIVATDDVRIVQAVEAFGGRACLTDSQHTSGTDRLAEVAATLDCDLIVNVQGDEPLVEPTMIEEALAPLLADQTVVMATLRRRIDDPAVLGNPHVTKVVVDANGFALYFSRAAVPYSRNAAVVAYKHIGLYVYQRAFLLTYARLSPTPLERAEALEQLRALEHGYRIKTVETTYDSIGVDTPEDLERVRQILAAPTRS